MKHIDTTHSGEAKARQEYPTAKDGSVVADGTIERVVQALISTIEEIDKLELKSSEYKGVIMSFMKDNDKLVGSDGVVLATWKNGNKKKTVDYEAIFKKYGVKKEDVEEHTKYSTGGRKFSVA